MPGLVFNNAWSPDPAIRARHASLDLFGNAIRFSARMLGRMCRVLDACVLNGESTQSG